jgi:hypothetical protein
LVTPATYESVIHGLQFNGEEDGGELLSREEAEALVTKHQAIFDQCLQKGSLTYYTVAQILAAENPEEWAEIIKTITGD